MKPVRLFPVASGRCPCCGRTEPIWSAAAIVEAFQRWTRNHGRPPSSEDWHKAGMGHPSTAQVREVFGGFGAGRAAAGIEFTRKNAASHRWDQESVIQAILRWRFLHDGRLPRAHEWSGRHGEEWPSQSTVRRLFGSWNSAVVVAGYEPIHARRSKKSYRASTAQATRRAA